MADDSVRTRIFEHPVDLFGRQAAVQRNSDQAEHGAGIYEFDVVGPVRQKQGKAISHAKTVARERCCDAFDAGVEFAKGQESAVTSKRGSAGIESQCPAERVNVDHLLFSFSVLIFRAPRLTRAKQI